MGKKLALNVLYNIGIMICLFTAYWGFEHARYEFLIGALFIGGVFIMLKMKLIKEVKQNIRN
ncbi:hypothetical protein DYU05_12350 [Mucilaginibacter terrenus]|uniref:Uncharacterized protein n=1 Tax=Mucilaginibacter terrenus TaxID=2482727 RepID=A0A3E2NPX0_9SPHI|nr:DUF6358 family protein [Mucilaginibacter terrenus]RFZ82940.1 hypothetical protein DYU05_12350 [Mucilaginibacter terrenus]